MNIIRTRHLGGGRVSQTIDGKVVYRGLLRDYPLSPDSLTGAALKAHLECKDKEPR